MVCGNLVKLSLKQFLNSMDLVYAAADLIVSRARVMICSESLDGGKPYILVMDIVDFLFVAMFDSLNEKCKKKLEAIGSNTLLNL
ncbi:hypothetical protein BC332_02022 [Capsicum chinense]|nr:hypothetical protein BC332_02022 [Capsicum chinense]